MPPFLLLDVLLQPFPKALPVSDRLPPELIGEALSLCEFLSSFGHLFTSVVHHEEMQTVSLGKASVVAMDILVF